MIRLVLVSRGLPKAASAHRRRGCMAGGGGMRFSIDTMAEVFRK